MKKEEFIKRIPQELQEKIGLQRFKISLIKCLNKKQVDKAKLLLDFQCEKIFSDPNLQTKEKSVNYLKETLKKFLVKENIKDFEVIDEKALKVTHRITFQNLLEEAIEKQKKIFEAKLEALKKQGIDTNIKVDSTEGAYVAILKKVNENFGLNYDISDLNLEKVQEFCDKLNSTYVRHLKSVFNSANKKNDKIINWFARIEKSTYDKFSKINKEINIFYYNEIENILNNISVEEQYYFKTLLLTGMRNDELASIKKENIKNNTFYFYDSKSYFNKIVPIHKDLLDFINEKVKTLKDDEYLFFQNNKGKSRVNHIRYDRFNSRQCFKSIGKTLHKTRSTFVTYLNFFKSDFSEKDITSLTHKLSGQDQESYNKTLNISRLKKIIDSIDLKKIDIIQDQIENFGFELDTNEVL